MRDLEKFYIMNQTFYLSATKPEPELGQFVVVGELQLNEQNYVVLEEVSPGQQKDEGDIPPLTLREIEIVVMVSEGLANKVIADRLQISEWTVSTHLRRTFSKLRVDSRAEMVYRCARLIDSHKTSRLLPLAKKDQKGLPSMP